MQERELQEGIDKHIEALRTGRLSGFSTGIYSLDQLTGRMEPGQVWAFGGYPGVGKTYFIQNMLERALAETETKIVLFTTELSASQYALRQIYMRLNLWKPRVIEKDKGLTATVNREYRDFVNTLIKTKRLRVRYVTHFEEIKSTLENEETPDIVFLDYLQPLGLKGFNEDNTRVTELSRKMKRLAMYYELPIVVASQITNSSLKDELKNSPLVPFDYGKELNRAAHASIVLHREKVNDKLVPVLQAKVMKAREGQLGNVYFKINKGYKLSEITEQEASNLLDFKGE